MSGNGPRLRSFPILVALLLFAGCGGGGGLALFGPGGGGTPPTISEMAPEPALPAGIDPVPALSATPMRILGLDFPEVDEPTTITLRLTAAAPIFADGTKATADVAATAAVAMGPGRARDWLAARGARAVIVYEDGRVETVGL